MKRFFFLFRVLIGHVSLAIVVVVLAAAAETRDSLTHATIAIKLIILMILVLVGFKVLLSVLELAHDTADGHEHHQNPIKYHGPFDFTKIAVISR